MIRDLVRYGDPRLLAPNAEADPAAPGFRDLLDDMVATCHAAPGIGLAAPQIGVNRRVAVIDLSVGSRPDGEQKEEEGCLSIPDLTERVVRPARVRVRAADEAGVVREVVGEGLLARALVHETDHLNAVLFVDRLRGLKRELTWKKIARRKEKGLW